MWYVRGDKMGILVNIRGEMVSFELGKEIEIYVFRLTTSVGQRKNSESP